MKYQVTKKVTLDIPDKTGCVMDVMRGENLVKHIDTCSKRTSVDLLLGDIIDVTEEGKAGIGWKGFAQPIEETKKDDKGAGNMHQDVVKDKSNDKDKTTRKEGDY